MDETEQLLSGGVGTELNENGVARVQALDRQIHEFPGIGHALALHVLEELGGQIVAGDPQRHVAELFRLALHLIGEPLQQWMGQFVVDPAVAQASGVRPIAEQRFRAPLIQAEAAIGQAAHAEVNPHDHRQKQRIFREGADVLPLQRLP